MCNCIAEANKTLSELNTVIVQDTMLDSNGRACLVLPIQTKRISAKVRKGPTRLMVAFCPFCGEKSA